LDVKKQFLLQHVCAYIFLTAALLHTAQVGLHPKEVIEYILATNVQTSFFKT